MFDGQVFAREIVAAVKEYTAPLFKRIEELEACNKKLAAQVAELQAGGVRYQGIYQRAQSYRRGDIATHDGSMFCALNDVGPNEPPGRSQAWQLCVRAGRDARAA
jgi:hypothetical protein